VFVLLLVACAAHHPIHGATPRGLERVGLAEVQLVRDLPAPDTASSSPPPSRVSTDDPAAPTVLDPERDGPFLRNEYAGVVQFGGGFIREGEIALETRARHLTFSEQDAYAELGVAWLADAVARALEARGLQVVQTAAPRVDVTRTKRRGSHPDDGQDNVNLPRTELTPGPLAFPQGAPEWVVVPLLRTYLAHNGGWFQGQTYGCMAGARVEALVVLYETRSGAPVWWMTTSGRHLDERIAQATRAQLEDYIVVAETRAERDLKRHLLR
jgi:hypothetical protein